MRDGKTEEFLQLEIILGAYIKGLRIEEIFF